MALEISNIIHAIGLVQGGAPPALPALLGGTGFNATVVRTAPGVYQLTTAISIDYGEAMAFASVPGPLQANAAVISDGVIEVQLSLGGEPVDPPQFQCLVMRFNNAQVPVPPNPFSPVAPVPGTNRYLLVQTPSPPAALAAGATISIPGPAAGFVRFFCGSPVIYAVDLTDAPVITATHQPTGFQVRRAVALAAGGFLQLTGTQAFALEEGQSIEIENTAAAGNDAVLWYAFYDLPAAGFTCVALQLSDTTLVDVIPAAPAGFFNRFVLAGNAPLAASIGGGRSCFYVLNDDTAAATIEAFQEADFFARQTAVINGNLASVIAMPESWTTQPLRFALRAPVATRPVTVLACVETLPLP